MKLLDWKCASAFQLCDSAHFLWRMELHSDHGGLHQPRPNAVYWLKHRNPAEWKTLGWAGGIWTGWKHCCFGNRLMLGNQSAFTKWKPEIQPPHQWVRLTAMLIDQTWVACCWPISTMSALLCLTSCPNPDDHTVRVEGNGLGTSNYFSFNTFQFSGENSNVYLHCKVELCIRQSDNCIQVKPVQFLI